jgi:lipoyl(octanoyl) transferase
MRWHSLLTPPADGTLNMALDEALMRRAARTGVGVLRFYGWSGPTLSLGRNQRARGVYDCEKARDLGIAFVRRPTGGRALLHHREITYSATLPVRDAGAARAAYDFINDVLLGGLTRLGAPARRASGVAAIPPGIRPCFDVPSQHEIVLGDRKLVGSAQWRRGGALLQHGSILVHDDQPVIATLMTTAPAAPPRAATLAEALGEPPSFDDVAHAMLDSLGRLAAQTAVPLAMDDVLGEDCVKLRTAYRDDAWTWRR